MDQRRRLENECHNHPWCADLKIRPHYVQLPTILAIAPMEENISVEIFLEDTGLGTGLSEKLNLERQQ